MSSLTYCIAGARTACYPALVAINRTIEKDANEPGDVEKSEGQVPKANPKCTNPAVRRDIEALPKYSIDPLSGSGFVPSSIKGDIEFASVTFAYPARPDVNALAQFSLKIRAGQTVALGTLQAVRRKRVSASRQI
jgi:ABC-type multidrug transport system fused ATPase/permease subunit